MLDGIVEGDALCVGALCIPAPAALPPVPGKNSRCGPSTSPSVPETQAGAIAGTVVDAIFKGSNVTWRVDCGGTDLYVLGLPQPGRPALARGARVGLSIAPESVILLQRPRRDRARPPARGPVAGTCAATVAAVLESCRWPTCSASPSPSTRPARAGRDTGLTLVNFREFLGDSFYLEMVLNSVLLGAATVVATLLIGYPVAFYLTRASGWERTLISVACLLPIFVNLIVGVLGWYILFLPYGVLQQLLAALGLVDGPIRLLRAPSAR